MVEWLISEICLQINYCTNSFISLIPPLHLLNHLHSRASHQSDTGKEEDAAQNNIHKGCLRNAPFGKVDATVNKADQTSQRQDNA